MPSSLSPRQPPLNSSLPHSLDRLKDIAKATRLLPHTSHNTLDIARTVFALAHTEDTKATDLDQATVDTDLLKTNQSTLLSMNQVPKPQATVIILHTRHLHLKRKTRTHILTPLSTHLLVTMASLRHMDSQNNTLISATDQLLKTQKKRRQNLPARPILL